MIYVTSVWIGDSRFSFWCILEWLVIKAWYKHASEWNVRHAETIVSRFASRSRGIKSWTLWHIAWHWNNRIKRTRRQLSRLVGSFATIWWRSLRVSVEIVSHPVLLSYRLNCLRVSANYIVTEDVACSCESTSPVAIRDDLLRISVCPLLISRWYIGLDSELWNKCLTLTFTGRNHHHWNVIFWTFLFHF